jgi:hypothetical protein
MEDEHKAAVRMDEDMNESSALDTDAHETRSSAKTAHAVEHARTTGHTSTEAQSSDETRNEAPAQDSDGRQPMLLDDALTADSAPSIGSLDAASNQPEFDANIAQPSVDEGDSLMPDVPTTTAVGGSHSDDEQTNVNAVVDEDADEPPVPTHLDVEESESEYEINDDPHCYCRLPWDGDEKMIECDNCRVWYHFDVSTDHNSG